ncbi:MAG TPA: hypothetical protein VFS43_07230, partial [Polyangiaceae bacterium]|nr:hypothetical protein [Polyangiaceae bacterium]
MAPSHDPTKAGARGGPARTSVDQPTLQVPSKGGAFGPRPLPAEFDDYAIVRLLGRGATGAVYLAEDRLLARQVA